MTRRSNTMKLGAAVFSAGLLLTTVAAPAFAEQAAAQGDTAQAPKKHSKLKGAAVGGAGGAVVGGKKGAAVGAAGGALVQHHKNKKEAKQAQKQQEQK
jgi:hypothetical protein